MALPETMGGWVISIIASIIVSYFITKFLIQIYDVYFNPATKELLKIPDK